jgi:hypothetical protein
MGEKIRRIVRMLVALFRDLFINPAADHFIVITRDEDGSVLPYAARFSDFASEHYGKTPEEALGGLAWATGHIALPIAIRRSDGTSRGNAKSARMNIAVSQMPCNTFWASAGVQYRTYIRSTEQEAIGACIDGLGPRLLNLAIVNSFGFPC